MGAVLSNCIPSSNVITINDRKISIEGEIGEGGFSFVYLVLFIAGETFTYSLREEIKILENYSLLRNYYVKQKML